MKTVYALPCACGKSIDVDRSQAGLRVQCTCGRELDVPTIRGLAELESRVESTPAERRNWGPRQGLIFLGLAIALLAGSYALQRQLFPPQNPVEVNQEGLVELFDKMTPSKSLEFWDVFKQGMDRSELSRILEYREDLARHKRWTRVLWGVTGAGLLLAAGGALLMSNGSRPAPRRRPTATRSA